MTVAAEVLGLLGFALAFTLLAFLLLRSDVWMLVADTHPIFKAHLFLGMTIFLVFPFTRLVHVWSAPIWYLGRRGYQVVRSSGRPHRQHSVPRPVQPAE